MNEPKKKAAQKVKLSLNRETLRTVETKEIHLLDNAVGGTAIFSASAPGDFSTQSSCTTYLCREN